MQDFVSDQRFSLSSCWNTSIWVTSPSSPPKPVPPPGDKWIMRLITHETIKKPKHVSLFQYSVRGRDNKASAWWRAPLCFCTAAAGGMFRGTKTLFLLHNCLLSFFCRKHFIATVFSLLGFVHILFYISFIYSSVCELVHFSFLLVSSCCHVILIPASPVFPLYSTGSPISPLFPFSSRARILWSNSSSSSPPLILLFNPPVCLLCPNPCLHLKLSLADLSA